MTHSNNVIVRESFLDEFPLLESSSTFPSLSVNFIVTLYIRIICFLLHRFGRSRNDSSSDLRCLLSFLLRSSSDESSGKVEFDFGLVLFSLTSIALLRTNTSCLVGNLLGGGERIFSERSLVVLAREFRAFTVCESEPRVLFDFL